MRNILPAFILCLFVAPAIAQPLLYTDAQTAVTGTWNGNGTLEEITTDAPYEGTHHYRFTYNYSGYWAGFGLNMDNWGNSQPLNLSGYSHLRLAYRGLSANQILQIQLRNGNNYGNTVEVGGTNAAYTVIDITMVALTVGSGISPDAITEIDFSVTGTDPNGSGTVYLDAVQLVNAAGGGLPASPTTWARANGLAKGVNCSNWLEAYWLIPFGTYPEVNKYNRSNISALRNAGFDVFRLPVTFERLGETTPPYALDFNHVAFSLVDSMILWAELFDFKLIIDNHHGYELTNTNFNSEIPRLTAVWQQLAQHYGALDPERYFLELYNEPTNTISNTNFRTVATAMMAAVRANETLLHSVFVGAATWNSGDALQTFEPLNDADIIYTFHTYDPFLFTHQGFAWTNPPYFPPRTFPQTGEVAAIQDLMAGVHAWSVAYDVPASLGEFGVSTQADAASRCNWITTMMNAINSNDFSWIYWDAISPTESFGFYTGGIIDQAHVIPCFSSAMGLYPAMSIALEAISADCRDQRPLIQWEAYADDQAYLFEIQRSANGIQWEKAGTVHATQGSSSYEFRDWTKGMFYRLKMVNYDESFVYSPVMVSECLDENPVAVLYPNPAGAVAHVALKQAPSGMEAIAVYDLTGRQVLRQTFPAAAQVVKFDLPVRSLPPGLYEVQVLTGDGVLLKSTLSVVR